MIRKFYLLTEPGPVSERISLGEGESLEACILALPGYSGALELTVDLEGRGASAEIYGAYLCTGSEDRLPHPTWQAIRRLARLRALA